MKSTLPRKGNRGALLNRRIGEGKKSKTVSKKNGKRDRIVRGLRRPIPP